MMMTPLMLPKKWSLLLPHNRGSYPGDSYLVFEQERTTRAAELTIGIWRNGHPTEMEEAVSLSPLPLIVKTSYYTCLILVARVDDLPDLR